MRSFEGFKRRAVIVVVGDEEQAKRQQLKEAQDGKDVPSSAILEMKANMSLPRTGDWLDEVTYAELDETEAKAAVQKYNNEGKDAGYGPVTHSSWKGKYEPRGPPRWQDRRNDYYRGGNYRDNRGYQNRYDRGSRSGGGWQNPRPGGGGGGGGGGGNWGRNDRRDRGGPRDYYNNNRGGGRGGGRDYDYGRDNRHMNQRPQGGSGGSGSRGYNRDRNQGGGGRPGGGWQSGSSAWGGQSWGQGNWQGQGNNYWNRSDQKWGAQGQYKNYGHGSVSNWSNDSTQYGAQSDWTGTQGVATSATTNQQYNPYNQGPAWTDFSQ